MGMQQGCAEEQDGPAEAEPQAPTQQDAAHPRGPALGKFASSKLTKDADDGRRAGELEIEIERLTDILRERDREHADFKIRQQREVAELQAMVEAEREARTKERDKEKERSEREERERATALERERDAHMAAQNREMQRQLMEKERQVAAWAERYHALEAYTFAAERQKPREEAPAATLEKARGAIRSEKDTGDRRLEARRRAARAPLPLHDIGPSYLDVAFEQPPRPPASRLQAAAQQKPGTQAAGKCKEWVNGVEQEGGVLGEEEEVEALMAGEPQNLVLAPAPERPCQDCSTLRASLLDAQWEVSRLQACLGSLDTSDHCPEEAPSFATPPRPIFKPAADGRGLTASQGSRQKDTVPWKPDETSRVEVDLIGEVVESRRELRLVQERERQREDEARRLQAQLTELAARDAERERQAQELERQRVAREAQVEREAQASDSLQLQLLAGVCTWLEL